MLPIRYKKKRVTHDRKTKRNRKDFIESDDDEQPFSVPKKRFVVPDFNQIAPDNDNKKEDKQDELNPYGYTEDDIDSMVENGQIVLVMPDRDENPSPVWLAGLRQLCFPDGKRVTNWNRCLWCGHNWNYLSSSGNSNMRKHVFGHFNGSITLTRKQLAGALAEATEYGAKYGKFTADTFERLIPVKHKKEKRYC